MLSFLIQLTAASFLFSSSLLTYTSLIIHFIGFSSMVLQVVKVGLIRQVFLDNFFSHVFYNNHCLAIKSNSYQTCLIQSTSLGAAAWHWEEGRCYQCPIHPPCTCLTTENALNVVFTSSLWLPSSFLYLSCPHPCDKNTAVLRGCLTWNSISCRM